MAIPSASGKFRSPNYPAIGLREAIQRLRPVYAKQNQYPTNRAVIANLMGYKSLNGASATVVSALSKFGLLEGHGDTLRVSDLGRDIAEYEPGSREFAAAIQRAAWLPVFFKELRDQYPSGLSSDPSLRITLLDRGFNSKAIDGAVQAYRETVQFVAEEGKGIAGASKQDSGDEVEPVAPVAGLRRSDETGRSPDGRLRTIMLPYSADEWASLQASFPLSESAWTQMIAVLEAMKPALIQQAVVSKAEPVDPPVE